MFPFACIRAAHGQQAPSHQDHPGSAEQPPNDIPEEIIPLFYQRAAQGIPRQWIQLIRRAMVTLVLQFSTDRMVKEYAEKY